MAQMVQNLPIIQETGVRSLGREDPLEEGMATHSSILAWRIPRTEEPGGLQPMGSRESDTMEQACSVLRLWFFKSTVQWGGHSTAGSPLRGGPHSDPAQQRSCLPWALALRPGVLHRIPPAPVPHSWLLQGLCPRGNCSSFSTQEVGWECPSGLGRSSGNKLETTFPALLVFLQNS